MVMRSVITFLLMLGGLAHSAAAESFDSPTLNSCDREIATEISYKNGFPIVEIALGSNSPYLSAILDIGADIGLAPKTLLSEAGTGDINLARVRTAHSTDFVEILSDIPLLISGCSINRVKIGAIESFDQNHIARNQIVSTVGLEGALLGRNAFEGYDLILNFIENIATLNKHGISTDAPVKPAHIFYIDVMLENSVHECVVDTGFSADLKGIYVRSETALANQLLSSRRKRRASTHNFSRSGRVLQITTPHTVIGKEVSGPVLFQVETLNSASTSTEGLTWPCVAGMDLLQDTVVRISTNERLVSLSGTLPEPTYNRSGIDAITGLASGGIKIDKLLPGGPAEKSGLQIGDIINSVDGQRLNASNRESVAFFKAQLSSTPGSQPQLEVTRGTQSLFVTITLENTLS